MDTADLAQRVPELMARHPGHTWAMLSAGGPGQDLRAELRPLGDTSRVATLQVLAGAEVYQVFLEGHTDTDFAYQDVDRLDALRGRIDLAAAATRGPTRVTLLFVGDVVVRSQLLARRFHEAGGVGELKSAPDLQRCGLSKSAYALGEEHLSGEA